jgi:hypothetical protein
MSRARSADPELDNLIAEITIDCYDEDEVLSAFENAFDEQAHFPVPRPSSARTSRCYPSAQATVAAN